MVAAQSMSSLSLIICLCIVLIIFILLLRCSTQRIIHMGQEISLLIAHLIILFARTPTVGDAAAFCDDQANGNPTTLSPDLCRFVAVALHFLFTVHFAFLFLEGLNNYAVHTFVVNGRPLFGRFSNICMGILIPAIPVLATVLTHFKTYTRESTCWCNIHAVNFIAEVVPAALLCAPAIVMNEAAGVGRFPHNPNSVKEHRSSAYASSRGAMLVIPLSFSAWFIGMMAVDKTSLSLYSVCSTLNLILGIVIVIAHTLGDDRARHLLGKVFCCFNCDKKPDTSTAKVSPFPPPRIPQPPKPSKAEVKPVDESPVQPKTPKQMSETPAAPPVQPPPPPPPAAQSLPPPPPPAQPPQPPQEEDRDPANIDIDKMIRNAIKPLG
uniref:Uncharacterized protein n=1 Tax=Plectus sambesii TaxID=2011161 RepID=A0A914VCE9_9BILA